MPTAPCTIPEMSRNCPFPPSPRLTSPPNQSSASGGFSWWRLHAIVAAIATIIPATAMVLAHAEQRELNAPGASAPATEIELPGGFRIKDKFINFDQERIQLTIAYRRLHQDPNASDVIIEPKMIILHWTAIPSFNSTWNYFNRNRTEAAREQLAAAGEVNVSAQFLVDRDGTIYRLMPENWMARHCIGLNHVAIGVENVGDGEKFPLTDAQVMADAALVRYLKGKYAIEYLIGHMEYRKMESTPLFLERDPEYRNNKPDPGMD